MKLIQLVALCNFFSPRSTSSIVSIEVCIFHQVCTTWSFMLPDDGKSISRNKASLNILVHDVINLRTLKRQVKIFFTYIIGCLYTSNWFIHSIYIVIHPPSINANHSYPIAAVVLIVSLWTVSCVVKTIFHQIWKFLY